VTAARPGYAPLAVIELYQAEWCPHSHVVRMRLTELGVHFVARQVPARPDERSAMRERTGETSIPTLVTEDGRAISGEDQILTWLDETYEARPEAVRSHRAKARTEDWLSGPGA
jgi:glutathione S-transferase